MHASVHSGRRGRAGALAALAASGLLAACGPGDGSSNASASGAGASAQSNLAGQVRPVSGAPSQVSFYAASRFLDQAAFGPTPAAVAEVQRA